MAGAADEFKTTDTDGKAARGAVVRRQAWERPFCS